MIRNTRMLKGWWPPSLTWWTSTAVCGAKGSSGCLLSFKIRSQHQSHLSTQNPLDFSKICRNWMTVWCTDAVSEFLKMTRLGKDCSVCLLRDVRLQVECFYPQLLNVSLFCTFIYAAVCSQVVKVTNQQIWGTCCPVMVTHIQPCPATNKTD